MTTATAVDGGAVHTCAIVAGGSVMCWGANNFGQFGNGTQSIDVGSTVPQAVPGVSKATKIVTGAVHTCVIADGRVLCWGGNSHGQLGNGRTDQRNQLLAAEVAGVTDAYALTAGEEHTCAATFSRGVQCWGANDGGQLGNGSRSDSAAPVTVVGAPTGILLLAAGEDHTCAATYTSVYCWGSNAYGQIGDGTTHDRLTPTLLTTLIRPNALTAAYSKTCAAVPGEVRCWGGGTLMPTAVPGLVGAVALASGGHVCALAGGQVHCWGTNWYGQLGDGTNVDRESPVLVNGLTDVAGIYAGPAHTCAKVGGGLKCWGDNYFGTLGNGAATPGFSNFNPVPTPVVGLAPQSFQADSGFRPQPDGFKFQNYGGAPYDDAGELNAQTLQRMFGTAICMPGTTGASCVLTATARTWRQTMLNGLRNGRCAGFALGSQRLYSGARNYSEFSLPITYTHALEPTWQVRAMIAEHAVMQYLVPADRGDAGWIVNYGQTTSPGTVLDLIRQQLNEDPLNPYYLGIYQPGAGGHAMTPYAIEARGNDIYWLYVYDSNWPNQVRYLVFDAKAQTWSYAFGAANPAATTNVWAGSTATASLRLRTTRSVGDSGWLCTFCTQVRASETVTSTHAAFSWLGEGTLALVNPDGQRTGWSNADAAWVNEIPDAELRFADHGTGIDVAPWVVAPMLAAGAAYTVELSSALTHTVTSEFLMSSPGSAIGISNATLSPGTQSTLSLQPNGRQITLTSDQTPEVPPTLYMAQDLDGVTYRFGVTPATTTPGATISLTFTPETGQIALLGSADLYAVSVQRILPDGAERWFVNSAVPVTSGSRLALNYAGWDGWDQMEASIGGQTVLLKNEAENYRPLYLPIIQTHAGPGR